MRKLLLAGIVALVAWVPVVEAKSMGLFGQCEHSKIVSGPAKLDPAVLDMLPVGGSSSRPYQCNRAIVSLGAAPLDISRIAIVFLLAGVDGTSIGFVGRLVPGTVTKEQEVLFVQQATNVETGVVGPASGACLLRLGPAFISRIICEATIADDVWQTAPMITFIAASETDVE
jgi:hypothetical protein